MNILHDQVSRAGNDVFTRPDFCLAQGQVKMWVVVILASGIFSIDHTQFFRCDALGLTADHITFSLLGDNLRNHALSALEVVFDFIGFVLTAFVLKNRFFDHGTAAVFTTDGGQQRTVYIHTDKSGIQIQITVLYFCSTIQLSDTGSKKHQRIGRFVADDFIDGVFLFYGKGIGSRVCYGNRIGQDKRVGLLQRIRCRHIYLTSYRA